MKIKKYISILVFLVCLSLASTQVFATYIIGDISYWHASGSEIGHMDSTRYVKQDIVVNGNETTFNATDFSSYVSSARTQWSNAGISTSSTSDSGTAKIIVWGGTYNTLHQLEPSIGSGDSGLTVTTRSFVGYYNYNGNMKNGYNNTFAYCYIIYNSGLTSSQYKNATTHELSHALGWTGHSSNSSDVMYAYQSSNYTLTTRDEEHLTQVY
jgi:predicted Zn-dependent protease